MKKVIPTVLSLFAISLSPAFAAESVISFNTPVSATQRNPNIDYNLNPQVEKYFVWVPYNFSKTDTYGLIVYISPGEESGIPAGWDTVLTNQKFLLVIPQNAGNSVRSARRTGLGVMGALEMMRAYRIDPNRVYAAGLSGGARTASAMAFWQPDIFRGTIQDCGSDYYRQVPASAASSHTDTNGHNYGLLESTSAQAAAVAKSKCKFVLITGGGDFRHGNILDIYNGGFRPDGFRAKLIDVPSMGHEDCDGRTLEQALDFLR